MAKYELFRTAHDNKLHRINLCSDVYAHVETLDRCTWRRNKCLLAAWFYDGELLVRLVARNVVFKDKICSQ